MPSILITGAKGFLGQNCAKFFKSQGYKTYGIGHGDLLVEECHAIGLDYWYKSDVTLGAIKEINKQFDVIIHCGGSGSVGYSVENPYSDFKKTVDGTLEVLEYIRLHNPEAQLIYPSSPAVQGEHPDTKMRENYIGKPASPYGYHKKIAEDLCQSYSGKYNLHVKIIRLFSVYGNGLKKQLLWDACQKFINNPKCVEFWGTGEETRDFIHIEDVLTLIDAVLTLQEKFLVINGGSGIKYTISAVIDLIRTHLSPNTEIQFNNQTNIGNPIYYWADTTRQNRLQWKPKKAFPEGLAQYIEWTKKQ
jgi:UDP-glucose 4-epimerase